MDAAPVKHSVVCNDFLRQMISSRYDVDAIASCHLIQRRVSDSYIVKCVSSTRESKYFLKLYRANYRTRLEIEAELALLDVLQDNDVSAPRYCVAKDGAALLEVFAPEGLRYAVLFEFISGSAPYDGMSSYARAMGHACARMHQALDSVSSHSHRPTLGLDYLLEQPLVSLDSVLANFPEYQRELMNYSKVLAHFIQNQVLEESSEFNYGLIHGDFVPANILCKSAESHNEMGTHALSIIDFDNCGFSWRAYDIAVFIHDSDYARRPKNIVDRFLSAYQPIRPLSRSDWQLIDALLPIRSIWFLAQWSQNQQEWGSEYLREPHMIKNHLKFTRRLINRWYELR